MAITITSTFNDETATDPFSGWTVNQGTVEYRDTADANGDGAIYYNDSTGNDEFFHAPSDIINQLNTDTDTDALSYFSIDAYLYRTVNATKTVTITGTNGDVITADLVFNISNINQFTTVSVDLFDFAGSNMTLNGSAISTAEDEVKVYESLSSIQGINFSIDLFSGYVTNDQMLLDNFTLKTSSVPSPPCFVAGTLIECVDGLRPIETLKVGDLVKTLVDPDDMSKGTQLKPIRWIGKRGFAPQIVQKKRTSCADSYFCKRARKRLPPERSLCVAPTSDFGFFKNCATHVWNVSCVLTSASFIRT